MKLHVDAKPHVVPITKNISFQIIFSMAYLSISEVIILNNDQHKHQKTVSSNNRINSKIEQQHKFDMNIIEFWAMSRNASPPSLHAPTPSC